ncbi:MAG: cysteine--tRNA ligase [Candidatus Marinimicrobia bacterium]|nr:cysteine--tRNA ligase [Candidatus Neomarinimicrobiota bacterium]
MKLQLYNSYSREKEQFKPIVEGQVGMYTCGPTVYDFSHIGNFRTFMFEDLLKRWLMHVGYDVKHIMNITDIDDKTIKRSRDEGVDLKTLTDLYTKYFINDLEWLKILPADNYPRATGSIDRMIDMIKVLIEKGHAYCEKDGSVYFKVNTFSRYGKLTNLKLNNQKSTKRINVDEYNKDSPHDFALWKGWKKEDGEAVWDAPWGKGRPGWHIECSAMSNEALGKHFDIHCGGVDNIFPHHENELAQSICANDGKFVNYWLHSEFLLVDGGKMSKSLKNFYTINDLKKEGFNPESVRYQLLSGHYRTKISFSLEKKLESEKLIRRLNDFNAMLLSNGANEIEHNQLPESYVEFSKAMNDDLNTPKALAVFFSWMKDQMKTLNTSHITADELGKSWNFMSIFNDIFAFIREDKLELPKNVKKLVNQRRIARGDKDWVLSDDLRNQIFKEGWLIEDTPDGQKVKKL